MAGVKQMVQPVPGHNVLTSWHATKLQVSAKILLLCCSPVPKAERRIWLRLEKRRGNLETASHHHVKLINRLQILSLNLCLQPPQSQFDALSEIIVCHSIFFSIYVHLLIWRMFLWKWLHSGMKGYFCSLPENCFNFLFKMYLIFFERESLMWWSSSLLPMLE